MQEIWKDINGYEGKYQVSTLGRVRSFSKSPKGQILKPHIARGYASIGLSKDGKCTNFLVHRLVAFAFIPNPSNLREVNHKDENKLNNSADNLEWCTREYNMAYGSARIKQGVSAGIAVEQLATDDILIAKYCSAEIAARINNIDSSSIRKCCSGKRKFAGGYKWRNANSF